MAISNKELVVGQYLELADNLDDDESKKKKYRILGLYTHHVLLMNEKGVRHCVTNAELYCRGILSGHKVVETPDPLYAE